MTEERFTSRIDVAWHRDGDESTLTVGRFEATVWDCGDYATWEVAFRGQALDRGTSNFPYDARREAEAAISAFVHD